jgi:CSLREA domain-containing protein
VTNFAREARIRLGRILLSLALGGATVGLITVGGWLLDEHSALAADPITVNSTADDTLANLAGNTTCDLREAIVAANTDTQVGQCNAGGGAVATINITSTGTILLADDLPTVTDILTINGPGAASLTIDGAGSYRHFWIAPGTRAEISGLTMTNGYRPGGAVLNEGILTLNEVFIVNNIAAAEPGYSGNGGAVYSTGGLTITNSRIDSNTAHSNGGGIFADFDDCAPPTSTLTIINSMVYSNTADRNGGGIRVNSDSCWTMTPTLMLTGSTVNGNAAADGGGIYLYYTSARLLNTTVSGNHSSHYGGGISTLSDFLRTIDLVNCTIYTNTTDSNGGGMQLESAFTVNLKNTIVAGNGASGIGPDIWGIIQSYDYNLIQDTSGATIEGTTTHNVTGSNPMLGPLANNGGRTWTHDLLAGSPAINAGSCTGIAGTPITVDQRGVARISPCDIGAYEYVVQAYLPLVMRN